jgi:ABC-type multidrug transport system fused ATPase/permease subunit
VRCCVCILLFMADRYGGISAGQAAVQLANLLIVAFASVTAGRTLHSKMLKALLRAPMAFFTATPLGRIMNRVSKDTADIDRQLASTSTIFARGVIQIIGVFVVIGMATPCVSLGSVPHHRVPLTSQKRFPCVTLFSWFQPHAAHPQLTHTQIYLLWIYRAGTRSLRLSRC